MRARADNLNLVLRLTPAAPTRPIDPVRPCRLIACTNFGLRNCEPLSVCTMHPATLAPSVCLRATAESNAATAKLDLIRSLIE